MILITAGIILDKEGKIFFETVYNSQKKRIFNALKSSSSDSVIKFKNVLKKIIDDEKNGREDNAQKIWHLLTVEQWLRNKKL